MRSPGVPLAEGDFKVRIRLLGSIITSAVALAIAPALSIPAMGQVSRVPAAPTGPAPHLSDGKPDMSGLWQRPYTPDMSIGAVDMEGKPYPLEKPEEINKSNGGGGRGARAPRRLPYTAWGAEQWKNYDATKGDYTGSCLPFGLMRAMNSPDPIQIMQNSNYMALLYEQNTWFKVIPLDKKAHDPDKVATWFGDSIAHWDGDTLVVDTTNFNGKTKLDTNGHPMSDQLHVIERFSRTDAGHIHYEVTIDDPKTYTEKWRNIRTFNLRPDWEIMEYSCEENNKDFWEGRVKVPDWARPK